jgi:hypothetical protein
MIGIQLPETVNYFVAKLGNIPDIPCVSRLVFGCLRNPPARPGFTQRFLNLRLSVIERKSPFLKNMFANMNRL